jgi:hypothetical protein
MSGLHLDGQVEASFDTFATASDQLDIDRLAELLDDCFRIGLRVSSRDN